MTAPHAYPLAWPAEVPRTKRRDSSPFRVAMRRAVADLEDALRLFAKDTYVAVSHVVISSNVTLGRDRPEDPGVAVYFEWDGAQRCIAVDRFSKPEDNVRAIYYVLEGRRQELRYGGLQMVRAAFAGFTALPAPGDWRSVLEVGPSASAEDAERAFRSKAKEAHPDQPGGSAQRMTELNAARQAARRELAG